MLMLMLMTTLQCIERCRGCSGSPDGAWCRPPEMDDRAQSSAGQTITHCTVGHYHTLLVTIRHCWPLSHCWWQSYHTGQTVKILSFLPDYHTIMLLLCQTHYQAQIQTKLHYFVACRIHSHCMAIPARLQLLWFGIRLVDHPTQLICIWIFICQHTKKTSQELRMLSSVTINCQITKIVMNSGSQMSEL